MNDIIKEFESLLIRMKKLEIKTEFEKENFKIDSEGWKKKGEFLENDTKDVWEFRKGDYAGEQLFTWEAAIRETKKAGKTMPTKDDFEKAFTDIIPDWPKAGNRYYGSGSLVNLGSGGAYWSSSINGANAYNLYFYTGGVYPGGSNNRGYGFSVRCLKD